MAANDDPGRPDDDRPTLDALAERASIPRDLAARLSDLAGPAELLMAAAHARTLVDEHLRVDARGPVELAGVGGPLDLAWVTWQDASFASRRRGSR